MKTKTIRTRYGLIVGWYLLVRLSSRRWVVNNLISQLDEGGAFKTAGDAEKFAIKQLKLKVIPR